MDKLIAFIDKIEPVYNFGDKVVMNMCKILLIIDILITSIAVLGRYVEFIPDPAWSEEVVLTCMSYMAVLSAALAIRRGSHIRMTALDRYLPKRLLFSLDILADIAVLGLALVMIFVGWEYAVRIGSKGSYVSIPSLSRFWMYFPVPLAGIAMVLFEIESLLKHVREALENRIEMKKEAN